MSPTPTASASATDSRRRGPSHAVQPPPLVTSLSGLQFQSSTSSNSSSNSGGGGSGAGYLTPTAMNSPFFPPAPLSGLATPLASRPASYTTAYNPQEWGPIAPGGASPVVGMGIISAPAPHRSLVARAGDVPASPGPPPPYSPPRSQPPQHDARVALSPQNPTPRPHPRELAPASAVHPYAAPRPRPTSMVQTSDLDGRPNQPYFYPLSGQRGRDLQSPARPDLSDANSLVGTSSSQPSVHSSQGRSSPGDYEDVHHARLVAPGSRRAASTGDINPASSSRFTLYADALAASMGRWAPGMPLPPPPPGPPPGASPRVRPAVMEPANQTVSAINRSRPPPPSTGTALGSVPPTPAGWTATDSRPAPAAEDLSSDQHGSVPVQGTDNPRPSLRRTSLSFSGPSTPVTRQNTRRAPSRGANPKEIRERRIESRNGKEPESQSQTPGAEEAHTSWPSDLVLGNPGGPGLLRRRTVTKSTPRSARSLPSSGQESDGFPKSPFGKRTSSTTSFSTPRALNTADWSPTPPFSPRIYPKSPTPVTEGTPQKSLPTPPPQAHRPAGPAAGLTPIITEQIRPVSHLHLSVDGSPSDAPLVRRKVAMPMFTPPLSGRRDEAFLRNTERRYREFLEKEIDARTDSEALDVFCEFITSESQIRRQRYSSAWEDGSFDRVEVDQKLFQKQAGREEPPHTPALPLLNTAGRMDGMSSGAWGNYKPALSPIASMSMSNDEMSSRGRPPSRWWESQTGSESGENCQGVHRSKRESKYMGLPLRGVMEQDYCTSPDAEGPRMNPNNPFSNYGPNEYPAEKTGWHDEPGSSQAPARQLSLNREFPKLDISRLVTLPPPYPRHYPGVNNNHPDLGFYRTTVRSVTDLSEVREACQNHQIKFQKLRDDYQNRLKEERQSFRLRVNQAIEEGTISYAEAAEAEAGRRGSEREEEKQLAQSEFDSYQEEVLRPIQSVLKDRINVISACINELQDKLFDSAERENPNQAQEEGDERPELLERLTQLKWLFEAREQLYREEYDLLSKYNEKFRAVVSLPYRQSNNLEKLKETDNFFIRDAQTRQTTFASETLQRFENFMTVIESNVSRGVEIQLSAFWDIAPSLLAVLQKVPDDLRGFSVKIPLNEYDENPSYYQYPLQYLYSLLSHAEKATYQFIESQTNLLCLLHEVKSGLMNSNCKYMEIQRLNSGEPAETVKAEMQESLAEEEKVLTADLKEKVGMVDGQWQEALGSQLESVKGRVQRWLMQEGGWDGILQIEQS
ncbi:hypothetical protein LOZ56_001169 [Ophidiomyces ophidiicola]|uniref:Uncharacterized protein n=1 Tax=Ophidiomyces ophidiicola TaxID=1387563 RepID=A0ACB8V1D5_9EURO|nr:hypothetical protein LOZ56_001169 [Ophidiomyces ophidiicola]KAI2131204.1 hypothetical protein LOZ31_000615 [Ophidiomyces ophidiicola]KAI2143449.1 hypothetical protein LOZ27_003910 [Ophidiomyces ophidiicola]KAI2389882.1 hypothetical protein LOY88_001901 [Ophidiomyces ophidiicola]